MDKQVKSTKEDVERILGNFSAERVKMPMSLMRAMNTGATKVHLRYYDGRKMDKSQLAIYAKPIRMNTGYTLVKVVRQSTLLTSAVVLNEHVDALVDKLADHDNLALH